MFGAALEQAQELADAANVSGYATRPLPLFYSFSQGLRAVSAASVEDRAWQIHGHGASVMTATPMLQTSINPKPSAREASRDALSAIAALGGTEPVDKPMRLGAVWVACPETPALAEDIEDAPRPLRLHLPPGGASGQHAAAGRIEIAVEGLSVHFSDAEVQEKLAAFPSLSGGQSVRDLVGDDAAGVYRTDRPQVVFGAGGRIILSYVSTWLDNSPVLAWPTGGTDMAAYFAAFRTIAPTGIERDEKTRLAFPSLGGVESPDFVALWWALLLSLSSLTRYEPALWTRAIEPDGSKLAVPIEQICDFAETFVPTMLLQMLTFDPDGLAPGSARPLI